MWVTVKAGRGRAGRGRAAASIALLAASLVALAAGPPWLTGCSYSPSPSAVPSYLKTIAIPVFANRTTEPTLEQEVTQAVVDRFVRDNHLRVVGENEADAVITGTVAGYKNSVFGFNAREQAQEYQVAVTVQVTVKDRVKNREMWKDDALIRTTNYFVVAVPGQQIQGETAGRQQAIQKIADAILNKTVEGW